MEGGKGGRGKSKPEKERNPPPLSNPSSPYAASREGEKDFLVGREGWQTTLFFLVLDPHHRRKKTFFFFFSKSEEKIMNEWSESPCPSLRPLSKFKKFEFLTSPNAPEKKKKRACPPSLFFQKRDWPYRTPAFSQVGASLIKTHTRWGDPHGE